MSDMIEAVARAMADRLDLDWDGKAKGTEYANHGYWLPLSQAAITAHTAALIADAGELEQRLTDNAHMIQRDGLGPMLDTAAQAAATIAALRTELAGAKEAIRDVLQMAEARISALNQMDERENQAATIAALQARAEAAEAECLEQARLVGMSGERELALRAELARVKRTDKELDVESARAIHRSRGASDMTDTFEAVALKLRTDLDEAAKQHMPAMVVTTDYLRAVLDSIAALKAEIERLTEREAQAKLDGVRAGIEASAEIVATWGQEAGGYGPCGFTRRLIAAHLRALDPEAIAKGIITAAALSDLIAGDAHLIDTPVSGRLADSDGVNVLPTATSGDFNEKT